MSSTFVTFNELNSIVQQYNAIISDLISRVENLEKRSSVKDISLSQVEKRSTAEDIPLSPDYLSFLPSDVLRELALKLSLNDLTRLCQTSSQLNLRLCQDEDFWHRRYLQDYNIGDLERFTSIIRQVSENDSLPPIDKQTWSSFYRRAHTLNQLIQILQILNFLTVFYHPCYGYDKMIDVSEEILEKFNEDDLIVSLDEIIQALFSESKFKIVVTENSMYAGANEKDMLEKFEEDLPYNTVIIELKGDRITTDFWFNRIDQLEDTCGTFTNPPVQDLSLLLLNSRSYITFDNSTGRVILSRQQKGNPLTPEDIFFASRALMIDPFRRVDYFTLKYADERTLHLLAEIDNWST